MQFPTLAAVIALAGLAACAADRSLTTAPDTRTGSSSTAPVTVPASATKMCAGGSFTIGSTTFDVRAADVGPNATPFDGCLVAYDSATKTAFLTMTCDAAGACTGAQIMSHTPTTFGIYQAVVAGQLPQLAPAAVLGEFLYPQKGAGNIVDGTREIDVEWAQWGHASSPDLNFSVWPNTLGYKGITCADALPAPSTASAYSARILWQPNGVYFETFTGRSSADISHVVAPSKRDWRYAPAQAQQVPQTPELFYVNLWKFGSGANGMQNYSVTVALVDFSYVPAFGALPAPNAPMGC